MKKTGLLFLLLVALIGLGGCSYEFGYIGNNSTHEMSGSYYKFNGDKDKEITVEEGETLDILVDIVTKEGTLDVSIMDENKEYSYEGHDLQTTSFTVTLSDPGKYTLKLEAKEHQGSFSFTW